MKKSYGQFTVNVYLPVYEDGELAGEMFTPIEVYNYEFHPDGYLTIDGAETYKDKRELSTAELNYLMDEQWQKLYDAAYDNYVSAIESYWDAREDR